MGHTHTGGLVIRSLIKLNQGQAILLYYTLAVSFGLLTILTGASAVSSRMEKRKLIVYNDRLLFTGGKEPVTHFFRDISSAKVSQISTARFLEADMKDGNKVMIAEVNFRTVAEFEEVSAYVMEAVKR